MHDPMSQAFEIYGPRGLISKWRRNRAMDRKDGSYGKIKWVDPLVVIWHVDPETDGTDDSCGFTRPKLSARDKLIIEDAIKWDLQFPYFTSPTVSVGSVIVNPKYKFWQLPPGETLALVAAAWQHIAWHRDERRGTRNLRDHLARYLSDRQPALDSGRQRNEGRGANAAILPLRDEGLSLASQALVSASATGTSRSHSYKS
jgi:hypothetical protein